jgi:hypothetical protein
MVVLFLFILAIVLATKSMWAWSILIFVVSVIIELLARMED